MGADAAAQDATAQDAHPDEAGADGARRDAPTDASPADLAPPDMGPLDSAPPDQPPPPDSAWPDAKQAGCKSNADCATLHVCTVGTCNTVSGQCSYAPGNAGKMCRFSKGTCDPAETCTGTSKTCPQDVSSQLMTETFKSYAEGTATKYGKNSYKKTLGSVRAGCYKDGSTTPVVIERYRGFVSFNTTSLNAAVLSATLKACTAYLLSQTAKLHVVSYAPPLATTSYNNMVGSLVATWPLTKGPNTVTINPAFVLKGKLTQFSARADEAACALINDNTGKLIKWATSTKGYVGTPCPAPSAWELTVKYCQ